MGLLLMAALEKTLLEIPAIGGLNQEYAKWLPAPFTVLDNVHATKTGSLEKRRGFRRMTRDISTVGGRIAGAATWFQAHSVATTPTGELLLIGRTAPPSPNTDSERGTYLWSYAQSMDRWIPKTTMPGMYTNRYPGIRGEASLYGRPLQTILVSGRYQATLYHTNAVSVLRVVDTQTGAVVLNEAQALTLGGSGTIHKCVLLNLGDGLVSLVQLVGGTQIRITRFDPVTGVSTQANIGTPFDDPAVYWDACPAGTNDQFYLAAVLSSAPNKTLHLRRCVSSTATVGAITVEFYPGVLGDVCGVHATGSSVTAIWDNGTSVQFREYNSSLVPNYVTTTMMATATFLSNAPSQVGCVMEPGGATHLVATGLEAADGYPATWVASRFPIGTLTATTALPWAVMQCKPFVLGGDAYLVVGRGWDTTFRPTHQYGFAVVNLNRHFDNLSSVRPFSLEGNVAPIDGISYDTGTVGWHLAGVDTRNADRAYLAIPVAGVGASPREFGGLPRIWCDVVEFRTGRDRWEERLWRPAFASSLLHLTSSLTTQYDGQTTCEIAFLEPPQLAPDRTNPVLTYGTVGLEGTMTDPQTYSYLAHWEWLDAKGNIHRSRLSDPIQVVVSATSPDTAAEVTLEFTTTGLTRRGNRDEGFASRPRLALYRTLAGGEVYYRCRETSYNLATDQWRISLTDDESDAQLLQARRGEIYTSGGILECEAVPSARHLQVSGGRVWLTSAEAPEVWPSRTLIQGEAPSFSPLIRISLDDAQTPLTGTAWLDGSLVIFSETRIYLVPAASGPTDNGLGGWPRPEEIQSSSGCISPSSIVSYQEGVLYRDRDGIKLLTRSREVIPIGDSVRDYTDAFPRTLDAVLDEENARIFILVAGDTTNGLDEQGALILVWDYGHRMWSTWSLYWSEEEEGEETRIPWFGGRLALWRGNPVTTTALDALLMDLSGTATNLGLDLYADYLPNQWVRATISTPWVTIQDRAWGKMSGALGGYQRVWRAVLEMEKRSDHGLRLSIYSDGEEATPTQVETWTSAEVTALQGLPRERLVVGVAHQKCMGIKLKIEDLPPSGTLPTAPDTGMRYHRTTLEIGSKQNVEKAEKANTR